MEIWVDKTGVGYLDGLPSSLNEIEIAITNIYRNAPDTRVHIIADRDARFADVNKALQILQLLQYRVVSFVVKDA